MPFNHVQIVMEVTAELTTVLPSTEAFKTVEKWSQALKTELAVFESLTPVVARTQALKITSYNYRRGRIEGQRIR